MSFATLFLSLLFSWGGIANASPTISTLKKTLGHEIRTQKFTLTADPRAGTWVINQHFHLGSDSCEDWNHDFGNLLQGIDWNRTASSIVTVCLRYDSHDELEIEMAIEPWRDSDIDYVSHEVLSRQDTPILGHEIHFKKAIGVIIDVHFDYFDDAGANVSPLLDQSLSIGGVNLHTTPYDFEEATEALDGDIETDYLDYIQTRFGSQQSASTRHFLAEIKKISLRSEVRFLFQDYTAVRWGYYSYTREIN